MLDVMPTARIRKNLMIHGRRTTINLEAAVWSTLTDICRREEISLDELCELVVEHTGPISMSSALRVTGLRYFMGLCEAQRQGVRHENQIARWLAEDRATSTDRDHTAAAAAAEPAVGHQSL